jgi:LuxR family maltose regulon positive regulatory protein
MQVDRSAHDDRLLRFPPVRNGAAGLHRSGTPELLPRVLVRRERLIQLIEKPFQACVTQVIAGAGYGKTALIADWATQARMPVAWIRLDPADNSLDRLVHRLLEAVRDVAGSTAPIERPWDATSERDSGEREDLISEIAAVCGPVCLVLDDLHLVTEPPAIALLNELIAALPDQFHLVLIGTSKPAIRLGRLRVMGQVRDIGSDDLRFTEQEIARVLRLGSDAVPDPELIRFVAQADGWATGIFLARLLLGEDGLPDTWDRHALHDAYLDEYVQQEILAPLDDQLQAFVLATAPLPFLTVEFCQAVLERADSGLLLAQLRQRFAFLQPLQGAADRFAYHPLMVQSLRRLAAARDDPDRCRREASAARWLLETGELRPAGELARRSGDQALLGEVADAVCQQHALRSDFDALTSCLGLLPEETIAAWPNLQYWRIAARLMIGRTIGTDAMLNAVAPSWLASGDPLLRGRALLGQGVLAYFHGDDAATERSLAAAMNELPADAHVEQLHAVTFWGRCLFRQGRDDEATAILSQAVEFTAGLPLDEQWSWRTIASDRGNAYALRGDIYSATTKYRLMLSELPPALSSMEGFLRCRLVSLAIERHELEVASREFERIEELLLVGEPAIWHHDAALARVRLLIALGERDEAEAWGSNYVKVLRRLPEKTQLVLLLARIWIERREFSLVRSWLNDIDAQEYPWAQVFGDINYRILAATLLLVEGEMEQALELSSRLLAEAQATRRWSEWVGISMRLAIALHALGRADEARDVARAAIARGARGGLVRTFFVPQFDVAAMFSDIWNESAESMKVRRRLQAMQERSEEGGVPLLTKREIELLKLVALGRSNQQIAEDLFISVNTVRNHLVKICRRLNAGSRLEAVARARELGAVD